MNPTKTELARTLANSLYQKCSEGVLYNTKFETPKWGYMVAHRFGPVFNNATDVDTERVARFVADNMLPMDFPLHYFGVWTEKETGRIYFNLFEQFANQDKAEEAARERNQIAIWDVVNKKEIRLTTQNKEA